MTYRECYEYGRNVLKEAALRRQNRGRGEGFFL